MLNWHSPNRNKTDKTDNSLILSRLVKKSLKMQKEEIFLMLKFAVSKLVQLHTRAMYSFTVLGTDVVRMSACVCLTEF